MVQLGGLVRKQTAVSHNCTEAEVISLDAGLRLDGIPARSLWDIDMDVPEPQAQGNLTQHPKKKQLMSKNKGVKQ